MSGRSVLQLTQNLSYIIYMKLPKRNYQKGMSQLGIVLIVAAVVVVGVFWLLSKNYTASLTEMPPYPVSPSPVPTLAWLKYESADPKFSLSYPNTHYPEKDLFGYKRLKAVYGLSLVPYDKAKVETHSVFLMVFARGGVNLTNWVDSHTTAYKKGDAKLGGKNYTYYNVSGKKPGTVGSSEAIEFMIEFPDANTSLSYTAVATSKYIFLLSYTPGYMEGEYQRILSSIVF